ncbi:MAG: hypothetical protein QM817_26535 [Archangium sp.]
MQRFRKAIEPVLALGAALFLLSMSGLRAMVLASLGSIFGGFASAVSLLSEDPGTASGVALALLRVVVMLGLPILALARAERGAAKWSWVPLLAVVFPLAFGLSLPALSSWVMWTLFLVAALLGALASWRRKFAVLALLPWVPVFEPLSGHAPPSALFWSPERIIEHCKGNDGVRPLDLRVDVVNTRYFSVTKLSDDVQLLAGERGAFWVHRTPAGATLGQPIPQLTGNFWEGCVRDGTVWISKRGRVCSVSESKTTCQDAPGPEDSLELDYVDVHCPPETRNVFVSQLLRGGVLEFDPESRAQTFHHVVDGLNLQLTRPRADGKLVGITTSKLVVIDPRDWTVSQTRAAGVVAMGVDLCPSDGALLVTDFTGRVRLLELDASGAYVVKRAVGVTAARRVAWAPGCERAIVTSGDDRHAYFLRRDDLSIEREFRLGPGLRDVTFLDAQTAAVADACTINYLR